MMRSLPVAKINYLFSLPSPEAFVALSKGIGKKTVVIPIFVTCTIYMLVLVSIFAPNALLVGNGSTHHTTFRIPQLNFDRFRPYEPLTSWDYMTSFTSPDLLWNVPAGCGSGCSYEFEYNAPALQCKDVQVPEDDLIISWNNSLGWNFLWNTPFNDDYFNLDEWNVPNAYSFYTRYIPIDASIIGRSKPTYNITGLPAGSICECRDGRYRAYFKLFNGEVSINTRLLSYYNTFTNACPWGHLSNDTSACLTYARASAAICRNYGSELFNPQIGIYNEGTDWSIRDHNIFSPMVERLFDYKTSLWGSSWDTPGAHNYSLRLKVENLSEGHIELFSNFTLNLMTRESEFALAQGITWENSVWKFEVHILWLVYGPALGLISFVLLYGFWCIQFNGVALDRNFLTIAIATSTPELDSAYASLSTHQQLLELSLHIEDSRFVVERGAELSESRGI